MVKAAMTVTRGQQTVKSGSGNIKPKASDTPKATRGPQTVKTGMGNIKRAK